MGSSFTYIMAFKNSRDYPYRLTSIDKQKQNWLAALGQLQQLIDERILSSALQPQINQVKANILTFKLSVPLIGKFSVGKSTLLNTWLEQNIQLTDLGACTSYPTEFHYSEYDQQKVVVVTEQDNIKQYSPRRIHPRYLSAVAM